MAGTIRRALTLLAVLLAAVPAAAFSPGGQHLAQLLPSSKTLLCAAGRDRSAWGPDVGITVRRPLRHVEVRLCASAGEGGGAAVVAKELVAFVVRVPNHKDSSSASVICTPH